MTDEVSIARALADAVSSLRGGDSPRLDAEILLSTVLNKPRSHLHAAPETVLDAGQVQRFSEYVTRRRRGEPLAYITGRREFRSAVFSVTADTLIPRPETELLVETALERGRAMGRPVTVIDLGTGTGCIALSLARERPDWTIVATDISEPALAVARFNAAALGVSGVRLILSDWFEAVGEAAFDLIVSNPPYIPAGDSHLEHGDVRFEPRTALTAGADGLDAIGIVLAQAPLHLNPGGYVMLEIGYDQADKVRGLAHEHGYRDIEFHNDLAGIPRVLSARWNDSR